MKHASTGYLRLTAEPAGGRAQESAQRGSELCPDLGLQPRMIVGGRRATSRKPVVRGLSPLVVAIAAALGSGQAHAVADFTLSTSDSGSSSFNTVGNWATTSPGGPSPVAPSPGFTYQTGASASAKILNTPTITNAPFGGDYLSLDLNGVLAFRTNNQILTFNNATANPGGLIMNGGVVVNAGPDAVTINGVMTVTAESVLRPAFSGRTQTINASIGGTAGLRIRSDVTGGGTVQFNSTTNTYDGDTTIESGGVLRMGATDAMPSDPADGNLVVQSGGTFELDGNNTTMQGLSGAGGVVNASASGADLTVQGDADGDVTFSGSITDGGAGALSVTKTGDTRQIFSGTGFSYTGGTTIEDGQLRLASGASLGSGSVTITGDGSGTLELDNTDVNYALTLEGRGSDTAHIDNIAGNNTVSGALTLQETVDGNDPAVLNIDASGGDLTVSSDLGFTGTEGSVLNLGGASTATVSGNINLAGGGTNALEKEDGGTWTLTGTTATDTVTVNAGQLNIANTLTTTGDVTVVSGAALQQQSADIIDRGQQAGDFVVDGAVDLNGGDASMNALSGTDSGASVDNTGAIDATLTLGNAAGGSYAGGIDDTGVGSLSIEKDGAGTQSIGDIDIAGTIDVSDGTLSAGTVTNAGNVGITGGSTFSVTGTTNAGDLDVTNGTATLNDDATLGEVTVASGSQANLLGTDNSTGAISSSGTLIAPNTTGVDGNLDISGGTASMATTSGAVGVSNGDVSISGGAIATIDTLDTTAGTGGAVSVSGAATSATLNGVNTGDDDITVTDGTASLTDVESTTGDVNVQGGTVSIGGTGDFDAMNVSGGLLNVTSSGALNGSGDTNVTGGQVNISGSGLTVNEVINLFSRSDDSVQLNNVANTNTITGAVNLTDDDDDEDPDDTYSITSADGVLNLNGGITSALTSGNRVLNLGGDGDGTVSSLTFDEAGNSLVKTGGGSWSVADPTMADGTISSQSGILALAATADLSGSMVYEVLADAELDVNGLSSSTLAVADTQTLRGGGLVDGNVIAASGSLVSPGTSADATQTLEIRGNLELAGVLEIDIFGLSDRDLLSVGGDLTIASGAELDLNLGSLAPFNAAYVFASYGNASPPTGSFSLIGDPLPTGYFIDYAYNGDSIALVNNDVPVPAPAPLALIGLGALAWGSGRKLFSKQTARA